MPTKKKTTLAGTIIEAIQDKKGQDITVIDLRKIEGTIAKSFIIAQGNSPTQTEAIAESISDKVREELNEKPINAIGLGTNQWIAIDYADIIVHIFLPETRQYYDLEGLWQDAPQENIPNLD